MVNSARTVHGLATLRNVFIVKTAGYFSLVCRNAIVLLTSDALEAKLPKRIGIQYFVYVN